MSSKNLRIGCASGFWGDSAEAAGQLVDSGQIDVLVFDYLAEITMSLLAKAHAKNPEAGYATDFPAVVAAQAGKLAEQGIKVVSNAGGVNPAACKAAIDAKLKELGVDLKVAIVTGDNLLDRSGELQGRGIREMFSGAEFPAKPWSINAYLGAFPIAQALANGADIVITGRCVDSAVALGPLIQHFGWSPTDYNKLAMGSLAGHVIECGAQATGGITTDWREVADSWDNMGYPIAEVAADGSFTLTKPEGTGGRITPETVAEQIVYEIGDPGHYLLPDVCCDFRQVRCKQDGDNRVKVSGAKGAAPGGDYKVCATYQDGFRATGTMMIGGPEAVEKAEAVAAAILKRTRRLFEQRSLGDYRRAHIETLGAEANWGPQSQTRHTREVILKIAVHHDNRDALEIFSREFIPPATSMAQGITGFAGGRPKVTPLLRLFSFLLPKAEVPVAVDGMPCEVPDGGALTQAEPAPSISGSMSLGDTVQVPLRAIAYGRSGDKGDSANIGVLARRPEFLPVLQAELTARTVRNWMGHLLEGAITRYDWPGLEGMNFYCEQALGGGGTASLRYDPQGKMLAQILMDCPVHVPKAWVDEGLVQA